MLVFLKIFDLCKITEPRSGGYCATKLNPRVAARFAGVEKNEKEGKPDAQLRGSAFDLW